MNKDIKPVVRVIGAGLAGVECVYKLAEAGINVELVEMRPKKTTPAHKTNLFGELVCSSSLKSNNILTAHGLLKSEMRRLGSLVIEAANISKVPGGDALCVDKELFSNYITDKIKSYDNVKIIYEEAVSLDPDVYTVIATGPLTSDGLINSILNITDSKSLYFFDAIAPSVDYESIDKSKSFMQSRYDKGEAAYINCPLNKEEYYNFIDALVSAERTDLHLSEDEKAVYYEGCLPVEVMASRGRDTLSYGMMKPVGLTDPNLNARPYAVLQLRQENTDASVWGLVGFQTQLKISEQKRIFSMIPALRDARFVRFGQVHRNTYINSPDFLNNFLQMKKYNKIFFAGQITGVEGYMESAATGIVAGINIVRILDGKEPMNFPSNTMLGALLDHVSTEPMLDSKGRPVPYQPMNSNYGILPSVKVRGKKVDRKTEKSNIAVDSMINYLNSMSFEI